ncbi:MAG: acid phosphatase, partial [Proteobacteria bacterium]|nr:acid phosphatase [Pseudomonadota bacterium]
MRSRWTTLATAAGVAVAGLVSGRADAAGLGDIETIVVIYAENRGFDHLYGMFPGANGIANADRRLYLQRDHDGKPLKSLRVWDSHGGADIRFPVLPNKPFRIDAPPVSMPMSDILPSPIHAYFHQIEQINGGRMDRFAAMSNVGGYVMGYFDGSKMKLWQWAKDYTLADNFFMAAFGGSYLNHQWLVCACTPVFKDANPKMQPVLDETGKLKRKPGSPSANDGPVQTYTVGLGGMVTADGYSVNTTQPPYQPSGLPPAKGGSPDFADPAFNERFGAPLPPQTAKTVGDTLSAKGLKWAWYSGGWTAALADGRRPATEKRAVIYTRENGSLNFQAHHQPFNYFARFAPGTPDRAEHLKDGEDFVKDIEKGTLPSVAFYKPAGKLNEHPAYTDVLSGDAHIADLLERLKKSPQWAKMVVIVTYDENGGFWDHVRPPTGKGWGDRWGPGARIPALIISPHAKKGFVDHTRYDTTSIL